jgi:lactoylglutathione lyase
MADWPTPTEGFVLTHFLVVKDLEKATAFYRDILGGEILMEGGPSMLKIANSWVILNTGGGGTDDKPDVILEAPSNPDKVSAFMNIRVADIRARYDEWKAKGAEFITEPKEHDHEWRCYMRDPDGHLIEVGQMKS